MNILYQIHKTICRSNKINFGNQIIFRIFTQDTPKNYKLNPYLLNCLKKNQITNLTKIQQLSLETVLKGQNTVITSETGSGKTLCYLIPVINQILEQKQKMQQLNEEKEINIPINNIQTGAIILAPTKELCAQVYSMIRTIDTQSKLKVSRTGSIAHLAPISDSKANFDRLKNVAFQNVVRGINWEETDILLSTPTQLEQILRVKDKKDPFQINPKIIKLNEIEVRLDQLIQEIQLLKEENCVLKEQTSSLKKQLNISEDNTTNFKEKYIRAKNTNKSLKDHIQDVENKVKEFMHERDIEQREQERKREYQKLQECRSKNKLKLLDDIQGMIRQHKSHNQSIRLD